jgi:LPXTG-motif cell wall-anchored protein
MKKTILLISMISLLLIGSMNLAVAQEQPDPERDTVNMDTNARPTFYYAVEDEEDSSSSEKGNLGTILIIAGAVVVVGAAAFFLLKKKK